MDVGAYQISITEFESLYRDKLILDSLEELFTDKLQVDLKTIEILMTLRKKGDKK